MVAMAAVQQFAPRGHASTSPSTSGIFASTLSGNGDDYQSFNAFPHDFGPFDCGQVKSSLMPPSGYEQVPRSMPSFSAVNRPHEFSPFGFDPEEDPLANEMVSHQMEEVETLQPALMHPTSAYEINTGPSPPRSLDHSPHSEHITTHSPLRLHHILGEHDFSRSRREHGQYTPPNSFSSQGFAADDIAYEQQGKDQGGISSEKPRSKKGSKGRQRGSGGSTRKSRKLDKSPEFENLDPEELAKREKFLERNRVAASKCRQKKKEWTNGLESQARELALNRARMSAYVAALRDEVLYLKGEMLKHTDCNCTRIHEYISDQAKMISPTGRGSSSTTTSHTSGAFSSVSSPTSEAGYQSMTQQSPTACPRFDDQVRSALSVPLRHGTDASKFS